MDSTGKRYAETKENNIMLLKFNTYLAETSNENLHTVWKMESALKATVNEANKKINALKAKVTEVQKNLDTEEKNNATLRGLVDPLTREKAALKNELKTLQDKNASLKQKIAEDEDQMYELKVHNQKLMCDLVQATNGLNVVEEQLRREQAAEMNLRQFVNRHLGHVTGDMQRMQYTGARF